MERTVDGVGGLRGTVSLIEPVLRYANNPILTAHDINESWREPHLQVLTAHNAAVTAVGTETVMLFRSHLRCGISVLGLATSDNGVTDWRIAPQPAMVPAMLTDPSGSHVDRAAMVALEAGGVEDPRINPIDGTYAITYNGYDAHVPDRVRVSLATTDDFKTIIRHGPMLDRDMRNVVIFPERIDGRYVGLFRPNDSTPGDTGGIFTQIHLGYADNLLTGPWTIEEPPIMRTGGGPSAFSSKIGPCAPPVRTPHGWLNLFHGVRTTMDGNPYVLGVALHDLADPRKVQMSSIPVLFPTFADCRVRVTDYVHVPNVVFSCGMVRRADGSLLIYYGGNDTVMNVAISHEDVLAELCTRFGQDPQTGTLRYDLWSGAPV